jgi:peptidoglycan hydrolase-like protein with peptidoglycan-binding domain
MMDREQEFWGHFWSDSDLGGDDFSDKPVISDIGTKGSAVELAQSILGFSVSGVFTKEFQTKVKQFQGEVRIPVTGILDRKTWQELAKKQRQQTRGQTAGQAFSSLQSALATIFQPQSQTTIPVTDPEFQPIIPSTPSGGVLATSESTNSWGWQNWLMVGIPITFGAIAGLYLLNRALTDRSVNVEE